MTKEELEKRIQELSKAIAESAEKLEQLSCDHINGH